MLHQLGHTGRELTPKAFEVESLSYDDRSASICKNISGTSSASG